MNAQFFASFSRQANVQYFARSFTQGGGVASLLPPCIFLCGVGGYAAKPELARASAFVSTVATYIFKGKGIRDTKYWISVQYRYLTILVRERGGYGSYTAPESGCSLSATGFSGVAFSGSYTSLPAQGEGA